MSAIRRANRHKHQRPHPRGLALGAPGRRRRRGRRAAAPAWPTQPRAPRTSWSTAAHGRRPRRRGAAAALAARAPGARADPRRPLVPGGRRASCGARRRRSTTPSSASSRSWRRPSGRLPRFAAVRVSDLLTQPGSLVPERAVWTSCPGCDRTQHLDQRAGHRDRRRGSPMTCARRVRADPHADASGRRTSRPGILLRDWMVENPTALFCRPVTGDRESIRFPPSA